MKSTVIYCTVYYTYRVVLCKGMNYPPVHPRPVMSNISLSIPLCDLQTEKSEVEVSHYLCTKLCIHITNITLSFVFGTSIHK